MEVGGQINGPVALPIHPWGKSPHFPLNRRLGEPQSLFGLCGDERNSCLCQNWVPVSVI